MTPLKAFWLGLRALAVWVWFMVLAASLAVWSWHLGGAVGLAIYAALWVIPSVTHWVYLLYRREYLEGEA